MNKYLSLLLIPIVASPFLSTIAIAPVPVQAQTTASSCYVFTRDLGEGLPIDGPEAAALAQDLTNAGIWNAGTSITVYDDAVASAVSAFQEKYAAQILAPNDLTAGTGFVGPSTRTQLNSLYGGCQAGQASVSVAVQCPVGYTCTPINPVTVPVACPIGYTCTPINPGGPIQPVSGLAPIITGIDGPTSLAVGQSATWSVSATDPQNGLLTYSINWGDNSAPSVSTGPGNAFSHTYTSAGTYTPVFTVTDSARFATTSSITVQVGTTSTEPTAPANFISSTTVVPPVIGAPSYTPTAQGGVSGSVAVTWPFTFTVSAGASPIYVSATPSSAVTVGSNLPSTSDVSAVSISGGNAISGDTAGGLGSSATGSYVVPSYSSRTFTVDVELDNNGNAVVANNAIGEITGIYFSPTATPAGSVTPISSEQLYTANLSTLQSPGVSLLTR